MGVYTVTQEIALEIQIQPCGHYAVLPPDRWKKLRETGETFWCAYGHPWVFLDSDNIRLRKELATAQEEFNATRQKLAQNEALLLATEKRRDRRSKAGLCQHCRRHFLNVERHVAGQHSEIKT